MPLLSIGNRVRETSTTAGTGTLTLSSVTLFNRFSSFANGSVVPYEINNGLGDWEIGFGTVGASNTLSRDVILQNSAGGTTALNLPAGSKDVFLCWPAQLLSVDPAVAGGRLSLESGALSTSDQTGKTTVYYFPWTGSVIALWNGSGWIYRQFSQVSVAIGTLTSGALYDVWGYDNAGTLALELSTAWSSNTARNDAIAVQDGVLVKNADKTRRLLGTIRLTSSTTCEDSQAKRFVWNAMNRVLRPIYMLNGSSYTYGTNTIRQMNATGTNQIELVCGQQADMVAMQLTAPIEIQQNEILVVGIGENSTTTFSSNATQGIVRDFSAVDDGKRLVGISNLNIVPRLGYSQFAMLEQAAAGTGQFVGDIRLTGGWPC